MLLTAYFIFKHAPIYPTKWICKFLHVYNNKQQLFPRGVLTNSYIYWKECTINVMDLIFKYYLIEFPALKLITYTQENTDSKKYTGNPSKVNTIQVTDYQKTKTNSVAFSPRANYTDWPTATCWRNLVPTFVDRGVACGQRGGSPTVVNLSFLDRGYRFT
jgi:hypothetical protein